MELEQKSNFDNNTQQPRPKRRSNNYSNQEIKTLFVSGLPADAREREIHNLFRFFPGYEGCIFNENPSKQPVAFVSFVDRDSAVRAMRHLQDVRFDINSPQTLRLDFAKSNSKIKRLSPHDLFPNDKRRNPPLFGGNYGFPPPFPPYGPPGYGSLPFRIRNIRDNPVPISSSSPPQTSRYPTSTSKVPPCSTLFVANIHPDVSERDLLRLFRTIAGFVRLKMSQKDGAPICFVEYTDIPYSTIALQTYQGFPVGPNQIRIEYARARMGESKRQLHTNSQEDHSLGLQNQNNRQYSDVDSSLTHSPPHRHIVDSDLRPFNSLGNDQCGGSGSPY